MSSPSGSPSTTPRRRHNSGRAQQDSETMMIEKVAAQAQKQIQKMKKVTERSLERSLTRSREAAMLSLDKATEDALFGTLTESFLIPHTTCTTNPMPIPSNTFVPAMSTSLPAATPPPMIEEDDEIWNKRQIKYVFALTTTAGLVFLLQPLLPAAYARWIIMMIAAVWGVGSIGLPCGLYGTSRCEKEFSRHAGRLVYTLFLVLVIYGFYLAAMRVDGTPTPTPSVSIRRGDLIFDSTEEFWCTACFGVIGLLVFFGNLWSSFRGCWTGGDRDP